MLLFDVFETAAALISEDAESPENEDLKRKAPYLISLVISELLPYDKAAGNEPAADLPYKTLDADFPLCTELASVCAYKLAYLLIADENTVLYTVLKNEYEQAKNSFVSSLPGSVHTIKNNYL